MNSDSIKRDSSISIQSLTISSQSQAPPDGDEQSDKNQILHPNGSGSSSSPTKKGSQSSLEFGRGERRSPTPSRKSDNSDNDMLKYATTTGGSSLGAKVTPAPTSTKTSVPNQETSTSIKLPQRFVVKYLGFRETSNLWGIKYTRRPVDEMVNDAKKQLTTNPEKALALLKMDVSEEGIIVGPMPQNTNANFPNGKFAIESISYGVQDLVYTRVFAMIVVKTDKGQSEVKLSQLVNATQSSTGALPFRCHAFVCDSRQTARKLTYSLATAFEIFSKKVATGSISAPKPKKFAIDLRPAEEIEAELADSEA